MFQPWFEVFKKIVMRVTRVHDAYVWLDIALHVAPSYISSKDRTWLEVTYLQNFGVETSTLVSRAEQYGHEYSPVKGLALGVGGYLRLWSRSMEPVLADDACDGATVDTCVSESGMDAAVSEGCMLIALGFSPNIGSGTGAVSAMAAI
jgi:hypothetical protein